MGARGKAPYLIKHPTLGERYIYQQVDIDETTLKAIARQTGGIYFRAEDTEGLQKIYDTIDALEKTEVNIKTYVDYREYYSTLLIPAFVIFGIWMILSNTRFLRIP